MPSQQRSGVSLFYDYAQVGLRLLELPPELLDSVSSGNSSVLSLKSATSRSNNAIEPSDAVVLCTSSRTYQLKQVSSSNTLLLLRPKSHAAPSEDDALSTGMNVFATCSGMLELLPFDAYGEKTKSARAWLGELLPVYDHEVDGLNPGRDSKSREDVFASVPYSNAEIQAAWDSMTAFQVSSGSYQPASKSLLALWSTVVVSATAEPIDLTGVIPTSQLGNLAADFPEELLIALLRRMTRPDPNESDPTNMSEESVVLNRTCTVNIVGSLVIACAAGNDGTASDNGLVDEWRGLLPERWRQDATADGLGQLDGAELLHLNAASRSGQISGSASGEKTDTKRKAGPIRNWHDKFKRTRT